MRATGLLLRNAGSRTARATWMIETITAASPGHGSRRVALYMVPPCESIARTLVERSFTLRNCVSSY